MSEPNERSALVEHLSLPGTTMCWSPSFCPGEWSVLVLPAALFFAPDDELARAMVGRDVLVYGEAHLVRAAFQCGAKDFLKEPWDVDELLCRALRPGVSHVHWLVGGAELSLEGQQLSGPRGRVALTSQQATVLAVLVERRGRPVAATVFHQLLYPDGQRPVSRVLTAVVSQLRQALRSVLGPTHLQIIESIRGVGYRLP